MSLGIKSLRQKVVKTDTGGVGEASPAKVEARLLTPRPPLWPKGQGTGLTVAARP